MTAFSSGPQTSVQYFPDPGLNGQITDTGFHDITTGIGDTDLDVGLAVVLGANGTRSIKLPGASTDVQNTIKGWTCYTPMIEPRNPRFAQGDAVNVIRVGRVWVVCQGTTVDEGPVYVIYSGANAGQVRGDAGSGGNAAVQVTRAKIIQGASAGNLAQLSVNLP